MCVGFVWCGVRGVMCVCVWMVCVVLLCRAWCGVVCVVRCCVVCVPVCGRNPCLAGRVKRGWGRLPRTACGTGRGGRHPAGEGVPAGHLHMLGRGGWYECACVWSESVSGGAGKGRAGSLAPHGVRNGPRGKHPAGEGVRA